MPLYTITDSYSDPITVAPGDAVQNTGRHMLFLCFATPADDDDAAPLDVVERLQLQAWMAGDYA